MYTRRLRLEGMYNTRDLGGYAVPGGRTRFGVFLRSERPSDLSENDIKALRDYGVKLCLERVKSRCVNWGRFLCTFAFATRQNAAIVSKFVGKPVNKFVIVELVFKQFVDVVVKDIGEDFRVELEVLLERFLGKPNIVLNKLVNQLVNLPYMTSTTPFAGVCRGLFGRGRTSAWKTL